MKLPSDLGVRIAELTFTEADACRGATGGKCTRAELRPRLAAAIMALLKTALAAPAPVRKPYATMTEAEFLAFLEAEPSLRGVDVKKEIGKCTFWCRVNNKQPTRKRIVNWLNKADRHLVFSGTGQTSRPAAPAATNGEPVGWRQWLNANRPDSVFAKGGPQEETTWARIEPTSQRYIRGEMEKGGARIDPLPMLTQEDF